MENHYVNIENRIRASITQVKDVDSFNEEQIRINLVEGGMVVIGENLNIEKLDLEENKLVITGKFNKMEYTKKGSKEKTNIIRKLVK